MKNGLYIGGDPKYFLYNRGAHPPSMVKGPLMIIPTHLSRAARSGSALTSFWSKEIWAVEGAFGWGGWGLKRLRGGGVFFW